jgi:hypothetical protein
MTALNLKTRFVALRANDSVVTRNANVVFGTAEPQTSASLFPCVARHPYPRDWQPELDRWPGAEIAAAGHKISRLAGWPGAGSRMSRLPSCRPTLGKCFAAT